MNSQEGRLVRLKKAKGQVGSRDAQEFRTFPIPALAGEDGRAVLEVDGKALYTIDVKQGEATLTTATEGTARVVATFDSKETLEGILEGRIHPMVAGLNGRLIRQKGDRRFGLSVLLGLRASGPAFTEGGEHAARYR